MSRRTRFEPGLERRQVRNAENQCLRDSLRYAKGRNRMKNLHQIVIMLK